MKKLITLCGLISLAISGLAQSDYADSSKAPARRPAVSDRISLSLYTGAGVGFTGKSVTTSATYLAPVIGYRFTPKFKLNAGFLHYNINGNAFVNRGFANNPNAESRNAFSGNLILAEGQYACNPRTTVSGGVLYNIPALSAKHVNYRGATLGLDYKVTPHTTFSIRTTLIQGSGFQPYEHSMFGTNPMSPAGMMMTNPFQLNNTSPFNF